MSWPSFVVAFAVSLILTPLIIWLSHANKWFDHSNSRKIHTGQVSRLGGISVFISAFAVMGIFLAIGPGYSIPFFLFFSGSALIFAVGLYDDFSNIRPKIKLAIQVTGSALLLTSGGWFGYVAVPFTTLSLPLGLIGLGTAFVWLVGMSNAMNLIDGLDGLSGGISFIIALGFGIGYGLQGELGNSIMGLALAGAILGFLFYNRPKAKIFIGDGGALFLGFALAALPLLKADARVFDKLFLVTVTPFLIPIFDTFAAIIRRIRRRKSFYTPDREHLHHKLLDLGFNTWVILGIVYAVTAILTGASLWYATSGSIAAEIGIVAAWALTFGLFVTLHYSYRRHHPESR